MKLPRGLRKKYSSAMLRPPAIAKMPSAMNSLLCMRWFNRARSASDSPQRVTVNARPAGNGLNRRTCTLGVAAMP